jgi:hypothetical protein
MTYPDWFYLSSIHFTQWGKIFVNSHLAPQFLFIEQDQKSFFIELGMYDFGLLPNLEKELYI